MKDVGDLEDQGDLLNIGITENHEILKDQV